VAKSCRKAGRTSIFLLIFDEGGKKNKKEKERYEERLLSLPSKDGTRLKESVRKKENKGKIIGRHVQTEFKESIDEDKQRELF